MNYLEIYHQVVEKKTFLCVGLDTDINKIPKFLLNYDDPIFEFNRRIISATAPFCIAYKPNVAFYEGQGSTGWQSLEKTISFIKSYYPEHLVIADAKRGDIGNTSKMYAGTFLERLNADAITVAPYMGQDSVKPFLKYQDKWVVLLALTSNKGAEDFELTEDANGELLFEKVLRTSQTWATKEQMMYVVGATQAKMLCDVRKIVPDHFLLVPGVGAQGGSLEEVAVYGMNSHCGLIVNSSRQIIYADDSDQFDKAAAEIAFETQEKMEKLLVVGGAI